MIVTSNMSNQNSGLISTKDASQIASFPPMTGKASLAMGGGYE